MSDLLDEMNLAGFDSANHLLNRGENPDDEFLDYEDPRDPIFVADSFIVGIADDVADEVAHGDEQDHPDHTRNMTREYFVETCAMSSAARVPNGRASRHARRVAGARH